MIQTVKQYSITIIISLFTMGLLLFAVAKQAIPIQAGVENLTVDYTVSGVVDLQWATEGIYSDELTTPTGDLTDLGQLALAFYLQDAENGVEGDAVGYIDLEQTTVYSGVHTINLQGPFTETVTVGPKITGAFSSDGITLTSETFTTQSFGTEYIRQFRLTGTLDESGSFMTGEYRETLWNYSHQPLTIVGNFILPVFSFDPDRDDDGTWDISDAFPDDPTEDTDTDRDGIGNNTDTDDDNDGTDDVDDAFPFDPTETADTDGDGIGDNTDPDVDGNGIVDENEPTPTVLVPTDTPPTDTPPTDTPPTDTPPTDTPPTDTPPTDSEAVIVVSANGGIDNIMLNWQVVGALTGSFDQFNLYLSIDGNGRTLVTNLVENTYADSDGLLAGVTYCYSVDAVDVNGEVIGRSNSDCDQFGELQLVVPNQILPPNGVGVPVAIRVVNGDGLCPVAMDIYLEYDTSVVIATGVRNTPYTAGNLIIGNVAEPGVVNIASIATDATCGELSGSGALFEILFDVVGAEQSVSPLTFVRSLSANAIYDDGDLSTPVSLYLDDGSLWISNTYMRGDVDGNGTINSVDALLALRIAAGEYTPTMQQEAACDANADNLCNAADSSLILCYAGHENWEACGEPPRTARSREQKQAISISLTDELVDTNRRSIPISFASEGGVAGGSLTFAYDPATMTVLGISTEGTLLDGVMNIVDHQSGLLRVAFANIASIGATGTLFHIDTDTTANGSSLQLVGIQFNDVSGLDWENNLDNTITVTVSERERETVPLAVASQRPTTSTTTLPVFGLVTLLTVVMGVFVIQHRLFSSKV